MPTFDLQVLRTADGVPLRSAWWAPRRSGTGRRADALLLNPAGMGDFLHPLVAGLADALAERGLPCLTIDSRGRDIAWEVTPGRYAGNAFGVTSDCVQDIDAGMAAMEARGFTRVAVLGHSLSGVRAMYYTVTRRHPNQSALITCSAPRLSHSFFAASPAAAAYLADRQRALDLVAAGQPDALFEVEFPYRSLFTAATYLDKYCSEDHDVTALAARLTVPFLAVIGEHEDRLTLNGTSAAMVAAAPTDAVEHVEPGAHHGFDEQIPSLAARIAGWLGWEVSG